MRPARGRAPVVVGVHGSGASGGAVEWASAEAAARGCALSVVYAYHPSLPVDPYGVAPAVGGVLTARSWAESMLQDAVARARSVASDLEVSGWLRPGTPVRVLLDEADTASLLVVGDDGRCGLRGRLRRSVAAAVSAHASCPVVVIRPPRAGEDDRSPPRVVVGVDGSQSCAPAVDFAWRAACQRGVPLVAVHAWTPDLPADLEAVCAPAASAEAVAHRTLDRVLDRLRPEFSTVPVHTALMRSDPARALVAQSCGAALLVVGSRGRGPMLGTVLGSVSQTVLREGRCPLAVIRNGRTPTAGSPAEADRDQSPGDLL